VGAKIAALPWNQEGLVVISYKSGQASMIWIVVDEESGDYELVEFQTDSGARCVVSPPVLDDVDWSGIGPDWVREHGTVVVLIGSEEYPDTVLGNPHAGEKDIKGLSVYLNSRFWDLQGKDVKVVELRSEKKTQWPEAPVERDDAKRPNNRQIQGARYYLTDVKAPNGKVRATGVLPLDSDRVNAEWYLWEGERPAIHSYAKRPGYVAVRYKGELFQIMQDKVHFRWFGVAESKVQQNLFIVLEPQLYQASNGRWGAHPDQSRNRLIFTGGGEKGVELPLSDWGLEFAESMPDQIVAAIREARGEIAGSIADEDYRKRLQDKFGDRWTMKVLVKPKDRNATNTQPATETDEDVETFVESVRNGEVEERRRRRRNKTIKIIRKRAVPGGSGEGVEAEAPVDVPKYRMATKDDFDKAWHLAMWDPNSPDGPTVLINQDSPILLEMVRYHQQQYPDIYAEEVQKTVFETFGEIAACKVAHSQKLSRNVPREVLDRDYRSEAALTVALMGLLAEEAVIAQRLGRLGRKKPVGA
jgi:hypothetical protein